MPVGAQLEPQGRPIQIQPDSLGNEQGVPGDFGVPAHPVFPQRQQQRTRGGDPQGVARSSGSKERLLQLDGVAGRNLADLLRARPRARFLHPSGRHGGPSRVGPLRRHRPSPL